MQLVAEDAEPKSFAGGTAASCKECCQPLNFSRNNPGGDGDGGGGVELGYDR